MDRQGRLRRSPAPSACGGESCALVAGKPRAERCACRDFWRVTREVGRTQPPHGGAVCARSRVSGSLDQFRDLGDSSSEESTATKRTSSGASSTARAMRGSTPAVPVDALRGERPPPGRPRLPPPPGLPRHHVIKPDRLTERRRPATRSDRLVVARPGRSGQDVGASSFGFRCTSVTFTSSVSGAPKASTITPLLVPVTSKAKWLPIMRKSSLARGAPARFGIW